MDKHPTSTPADPTPAPSSSAPVAAAPERVENVIHIEGVLDIDLQKGGNGQLLDLSKFGKRRPSDAFVPKELIRRFKLRQGSVIGGTAYPAEGKFPNPKMKFIETVDGLTIDERRAKLDFTALTTVSPDKQIKMEL
jgi:transcription termination factor Rho